MGLLSTIPAQAAQPRITVTGSNVLTFRLNSVNAAGAAGQQSFLYSNYERQRQIENNASINVTGILVPRLTLNFNLNSSRYSPDRSTYNLEYKGNGLQLQFGDINAALQGNEFAPFSRSLRGVKAQVAIGKFDLTTLLSQERAQVAIDTFQGTNSAGPYMLKYSPIVDGTQQVRVDGQVKTFGTDYTLDFNTGMLWFQGTNGQSTIIPATSTVEVSYEYAGWGHNPGTLVGMRGVLPLGKLGQIGTTYITQMSAVGNQGPEANYRTDLLVGENRAMVVTLRYRPLKRIIKITVDGVPQQENLDYIVQSLDAGIIAFQKVVPAPPGLASEAAANVVIDYEIQDTTSAANVGGDRGILGLDTTLNLAPKTTLGIQFGHSGGGTSRSGNALSVRGNSVLGNFTLGLGYRDIGQTFSAIESVGFQQKERAIEGSLEYRASPHLRFAAHTNSSERPSNGYLSPYSLTGSSLYGTTGTTTTGTGTTTTGAATGASLRAVQNSINVVMDYPKLPGVEIGHQQFSTVGSGMNSDSGMSTLNLHYALFTALNFTANLTHQLNQDHSSLGAQAESLTQHYNLAYTPGTRFSTQLDFTLSNLRSRTVSTGTAGTTTTTTTSSSTSQLVNSTNRAQAANLTVTYMPIRMATLTANLRIQDSGSGGLGGMTGGYYGGMANSYYSSNFNTGYLNSGNASYGNQYTGDFYSMGSSLGSSSLYGTGYGTGTTGTGTGTTGTTGSSSIGALGSVIRAGAFRDTTPAATGTDTTTTGSTTGTDTGTTTSGTTTTDTTTGSTTTNTSTRIRGITRSIGIQLNPMDHLSLRADYMHDLQEGQFTSSNSVSTTTTFGFTYTPWEKLTLNGQHMIQNYNFIGAGGSSGSNISFIDANLQQGKFTYHLNFQTMTSTTGLTNLTGLTGLTGYGSYTDPALTGTGSSLTDTTTGTTIPTATGGTSTMATRMDTLTGRIEHPILKKYKLFTELQHSRVHGGGFAGTTTSPENSSRLQAALGLEIGLGNHLSWSMDVRRIMYKDQNNPTRNYQGNLVTGEMRMNFW